MKGDKKQIGIIINTELYKSIEEIAEFDERTIAGMVRVLLKEAVKVRQEGV